MYVRIAWCINTGTHAAVDILFAWLNLYYITLYYIILYYIILYLFIRALQHPYSMYVCVVCMYFERDDQPCGCIAEWVVKIKNHLGWFLLWLRWIMVVVSTSRVSWTILVQTMHMYSRCEHSTDCMSYMHFHK